MNNKEIRYQQAKERVEALKGFYIHLAVYVIVNLFFYFSRVQLKVMDSFCERYRAGFEPAPST